MRKNKLIFVFIFLAGMVFTVLQYIPILEEDNLSATSELVKKDKESDTSSDNDGDDDNDDVKTELNTGHLFDIVYYSSVSNKVYSKSKIYNYLVENINTPPPKI